MNEKLFKKGLEQLTETQWQSLIEGQGLLIKSDKELFVGTSDSSSLILRGTDFSFTDAFDLKAQILQKADVILNDYYRSHPLSQEGFNHQVEKLVEEFGVGTFCAPRGKIANRTFFVEGGEVVAEPVESPRHRYGVFFEMERQLPGDAMEDAFNKWVSIGEAYSEYIGMNVCRYNC